MLLHKIATIVKTRINAIKEDPHDNIILEATAEMKIDYIISGDNHLLQLKEFNGAKILDPKQFLGIIKE